ncbi:T9SS type A sorting domain-containing protein [bacterium]|nr:T9SS type A sorting domain-containing protein [bacterium]
MLSSRFTRPSHLLGIILSILFFVLLCHANVAAQQATLTISAGTVSMSSGFLYLSGNWTNNGEFTADGGTVVFNGTGDGTITNASGETFNNLTVNKSSGDLVLNNNVTVKDTLTLTSGNVSTGANTLTLGTTSEGTLSRTSGTILGNFARYIGITTGSRLFPVGTSSNYRPYSINYTIAPTSAGTITVSHIEEPGNFEPLSPTLDDSDYILHRRSKMYWTTTDSSIAGGTYNLSLDANGQAGIEDPANLRVIHSNDGTNFDFVGTHSDGSGTTARRTGIDGDTFGWFYIGGNINDNSLPVALSSFVGTPIDSVVYLKWRTETEVNNLGFSIYRSEEEDGNYTKIDFVPGLGSSAMPIDYQFTDKGVEAGKTYFYYLEDIDIAGEKSKSKIIKVVVPPAKPVLPIPKEFRLLQNYPNPFNPDTWLPYELAADAPVTIRIYNLNGQFVRQLDFGKQEAGYYVTRDKAAYWDGNNKVGEKVASGVYWYTLRAGEFHATQRLVIMK